MNKVVTGRVLVPISAANQAQSELLNLVKEALPGRVCCNEGISTRYPGKLFKAEFAIATVSFTSAPDELDSIKEKLDSALSKHSSRELHKISLEDENFSRAEINGVILDKLGPCDNNEVFDPKLDELMRSFQEDNL